MTKFEDRETGKVEIEKELRKVMIISITQYTI